MTNGPEYPWRIDTNDRYRELVSAILSLSTAALFLPILLAREFLGVPEKTPLKDALIWTAYCGWGLLAVSILCCIAFYYFSAKWARIAWKQTVSVFGKPISEGFVERAPEISLWVAIGSFLAGVVFTLLFLVGFVPRA